MRLATYCLISALALTAKDQSVLPWKNIKKLPWQIVETKAQNVPPVDFPTQSYLPLTISLKQNGNIKIADKKGRIRARLGLPGRPQKVWRDWGIRIINIFDPILFPNHSSLQQGIDNVLTNILDFRSRLEGLLWILSDDVNILTVINPATSQVVYISLPSERDLNLTFYPDRIEASEEQPAQNNKVQTSWSLYWLELLPYFIQLSTSKQSNEAHGSAFEPFKK